MNRYPLWKYLLIGAVVLICAFYALPNLFGQTPALQVASRKATVKVEPDMVQRVEKMLADAKVSHTGVSYDVNGPTGNVRIRFKDTDDQARGKDALQQALNGTKAAGDDDNFVLALNLTSNTPRWMAALRAAPMSLGLDLRGGVHFLLQVDMKGAITKRYASLEGDVRSQLRDKQVRGSLERRGDMVVVKFRDDASRTQALRVLRDNDPQQELQLDPVADGIDPALNITLKPTAIKTVQDNALKQNITTLHNRINELGVAEPVIQQQGSERIVVQLPGVQDIARAQELIGRTATLEMRLVDDTPEAQAALQSGSVPFDRERFIERSGAPILLRKQIIISGDNLQDAQAGFDSQTQEPAVHLNVDAKGGRVLRDVSSQNIGKRMAILLIERKKAEVISAPVFRGEIGSRFQISGAMSATESADLALLLRAGSLAAPMEIIESRVIGPSLGAENIKAGFNSTLYGFAAIAVFMISYYLLMGMFSVIALAVNVCMLIAALSMLGAVLTLPGIAAIALTLGMAIDSNVLINERIREELRAGKSPQQAISEGFQHAWDTILDSNVTTLIVGLALLVFGSGPVRGFAVVHCLGILTSMFSAVLVARAMVNLYYGGKKKLSTVSIGQVWRAEEAKPASK